MEDKLVYFDLCGALLDIFVDNEADFKYISSIVRESPVAIVEGTFLEWITLVRHTILLTPVPSIWSRLDKNIVD